MKARALATFTALVTLAALLSCASCTKENLLVVTSGAADACDVIEIVTADGLVKAICVAVDALDALARQLFAAQRLGVGVVLLIERPDGSIERLIVAPEGVAKASISVGAARARGRR